MFFTITIQTYNSADTLDATLRQVCALPCSHSHNHEILVVDNNSSDHTARVIRNYAQIHGPRLRSVFEAEQGLSHARNRALKEAVGEVVCFLDDDVIIDLRWLDALATAFEKYGADVVGGRSYLIYPGQRPEWLGPQGESLLSRLDYGDEPLVNTDKDLYGLNLAVRRSLAVDLGGFRTDLGRRGRSLNCGEEIDLLNRVRRAGGTVVYEPAAVVGHLVKPQRLSKRWLLRRTYAGALVTERLRIQDGQVGGATRLFVHSARCCGSVLKSLLWKRDSAAELFEKQYFAAYSLGRLAAALGPRSAQDSPALQTGATCMR